MSDAASDALAPLDFAEAAEVRAATRSALRRLLELRGSAALLAGVDAVGAEAMDAAAALTARLGTVTLDGRAEALLAELNALVLAVHEPPPPRGLFARRPPPIEERLRAAEPALARTHDALARECDRLAQAGLAAARLTERLAGAEAELARAAHLLRGLAAQAEAAGRELTLADPARAALFAGEVAERATERARDVLTQLAVLRQARLSVALLRDGQDALVRAIDRTRRVLTPALRTAAAAARAAEAGARSAVAAAVGEMRAALRRDSDGAS